METVDALVVGAGVIGLAVARALALRGREVVVVERQPWLGGEISSRNSEVVHAGLYYPPGSLMARHCVAGRTMLYRYCAERGVPIRRSGKLIVATSAEEAGVLAAIRSHAEANGVEDLVSLSTEDALTLEPALACHGALLSPSTGILDSHAYMLALAGDAEAAGAMIALSTAVLGGRVEEHGIEVRTDGPDAMTLRCRTLVNAGGLHAAPLAQALEGLAPSTVPEIRYAKGSYFVLEGASPFSRLIYPVPVPGGLGTHLTLDLAGRARFGPDVEWVDAIDYEVDASRAAGFHQAIRRYWPGIEGRTLHAGYAGIRPKLTVPPGTRADFLLQDARGHGVPGLINLYGIESPGLTSSLALAEDVAARC